MEFLKEWITTIIIFILLATVIDMILPSSKLQKYTKMVTGLLLIAIILTPIFKFVSSDFEQTIMSLPTIESTSSKEEIENSIEMQKKEIQASSRAYALENVEKAMKASANEELVEKYGVEITKIEMIEDDRSELEFPQNLQKVYVQVQPVEGGEQEAVEVVQNVEVDTGKPIESEATTTVPGDITSLLSTNWEIDEKVMEVFLEEGGMAKDDG
ncbi:MULTISPECIES: stage III sporulation protein AF [Cytobacillus]|uniref:stage III sporulation protein AF n=1 Tax=Cytobacillus TaxID=2675230 RepID=UPI001CD296A1|nr:stage III sporulation protein AF [Cytobacillus kochii]MCA1025531.1 stage III sporulation protein AF [Cytobacillus kochii]MCM3320633.1 stage III sporulation protein AF [Cytobacillus kochii]MCM3344533.1 stage III sporulation protein AF [Cytobacillus kochii]